MHFFFTVLSLSSSLVSSDSRSPYGTIRSTVLKLSHTCPVCADTDDAFYVCMNIGRYVDAEIGNNRGVEHTKWNFFVSLIIHFVINEFRQCALIALFFINVIIFSLFGRSTREVSVSKCIELEYRTFWKTKSD